jgi:hypothetical protein
MTYTGPHGAYRFVLSSDWHYEPYSDNSLLYDMLERAKTDGMRVFGFGDLFDAIFPTDNRRRSATTMKQSQTDGPINEIMNAAEEFFAPYADVIDFLSYGNHETTVLKWSNFDPVQDLHSRLSRHRTLESPILRGRYSGFLLLRFTREKQPKNGVQRVVMYYDHGRGGNPEVTKGTISLERMYTEHVADVYFMGHIHKAVIDPSRTTSFVDGNNRQQRRPKYGVVNPSLTVSQADGRDPSDNKTPLTRDYGEEAAWTSQTQGYTIMEVRKGNQMSLRLWTERL